MILAGRAVEAATVYCARRGRVLSAAAFTAPERKRSVGGADGLETRYDVQTFAGDRLLPPEAVELA